MVLCCTYIHLQWECRVQAWPTVCLHVGRLVDTYFCTVANIYACVYVCTTACHITITKKCLPQNFLGPKNRYIGIYIIRLHYTYIIHIYNKYILILNRTYPRVPKWHPPCTVALPDQVWQVPRRMEWHAGGGEYLLGMYNVYAIYMYEGIYIHILIYDNICMCAWNKNICTPTTLICDIYIYLFICLFDMIFDHGSPNNIVIMKLLSQICLGELAQRSLATSGCDNSLTEFRHEEVVSDWNLWKNQGLN